jgi:hypothetical protein
MVTMKRFLAGASALFVASTAVLAAPANTGGGEGLEEVIVTAQKRSESEQSTTSRTDQPNYAGDGIVNVPIIQDRAALRLSGFYDEEAGYFKRSYCTDPVTAGISCFPLSSGHVECTWNARLPQQHRGSHLSCWIYDEHRAYRQHVQTGVKSFGCENSTAHELPSHS